MSYCCLVSSTAETFLQHIWSQASLHSHTRPCTPEQGRRSSVTRAHSLRTTANICFGSPSSTFWASFLKTAREKWRGGGCMKINCSEYLALFASAIQKERRGWGGEGGCGLIKAIPPRERSVSSAVNSSSPQPLYLVIQKLYKRVLGLHAGSTQSGPNKDCLV